MLVLPAAADAAAAPAAAVPAEEGAERHWAEGRQEREEKVEGVYYSVIFERQLPLPEATCQTLRVTYFDP